MKGKPHILIIDGDKINCVAISLMVEKAGYESSEVLNGIRALEILKENRRIDAVILNRILSGIMSSIDLMQRIQALPAAIKNIPVVMLTDRAEKSRIKASMIFGVSDVLYKPIDESLLHKTLEKILQKSHKGKV